MAPTNRAFQPIAPSITPQMLPATFVVNNDGREACFCPLPEDTDGLYVLFFNQGTLHGSKKISADAAQLGETVMLPVLLSPENMSDAVSTSRMLRHIQAHNAVGAIRQPELQQRRYRAE